MVSVTACYYHFWKFDIITPLPIDYKTEIALLVELIIGNSATKYPIPAIIATNSAATVVKLY